MMMNSTDAWAPREARTRAVWLIWAAWLAALAMLTRPYRGVFHDGHLYAVQALRRLDGSMLDRDIFFAFGNQDSFSVFTLVYAPVISAIGISAATLLFYALGLVFWTGALLFLAVTLLSDQRQAVLATAFALCLYPAYGSLPFSYGEGFVTPRIFAEGAGFVAIAFSVRSKLWLAAGCAVVALVLHPLMGLSTLALSFWLVCRRKYWFILVGLIAFGAGLFLGWAAVEPFSWIYQSVDADWMAMIEKRAPLVLISEWPVELVLGWLPLPVLSLLVVWRNGAAQLRDLVAGVLFITLGFSLMSFVLADLLSNRFFVGLQLWRAEVLIALFGNFFAFAALRSMKSGHGPLLFGIALGFSIIVFLANLSPLPIGLMACAAGIAWIAEDRAKGPVGIPWKIAYSIPFLAAVLVFATLVIIAVPSKGWEVSAWIALRIGLVGFAIWALFRSEKVGVVKRQALSLGLCLMASIAVIDLRPARQIFWANNGTVPPAFEEHLVSKTVYWEGELVSLWIGLRLPQYYSCRQSGGMVFFEGQAKEIFRRAGILRQLNSADFDDSSDTTCSAKQDLNATGPQNAAVVSDVCRALPELDQIVLKTNLPGFVQAEWTAPFSSDDKVEAVPVLMRRNATAGTTSFYMYDCDELR